MEEWHPIRTVADNIVNRQSRTVNKGCPPACGLGKVLTTHRRNWSCYESDHLLRGWTAPLVQTKQWKTDMRFGTWEDNIKMDLQEVGWEGMEWTDLGQDREWWWALVNVVMNLQDP